MQHLRRWSGVCRRANAYALALILVTCIGCDSQDNDDDGNASAGSRLGWNQMAASAQQVQSMTFRLYVDGTPMALSNVTCGQTASSAGYGCTGRLPSMSTGSHVLELASVLGGVESPRSAPLTITFNGTAQTFAMPGASVKDTEAPAPSPGTSSGALSRVICLAGTGRCHGERVVASGLSDVTNLSPLPDGRLLFIERGMLVRVIDDGLIPEPALTAPDGATLVGLAVDPSFARTRYVFVAWAERGDDDSDWRLTISRYRELAGSLGEGARIVTTLPFRAGAVAPLALDAAGLLYVALPWTEQLALLVRGESHGTGALLRFTHEGTVPAASGSPVLGLGYARPSSMAIDTTHQRVWLAGEDPGQSSRIASLPIPTDGISGIGRPDPLTHPAWPMPPSEPTLAVLPARGPGQYTSVIIGSAGRLLRGVIGDDGRVGELTPFATSESSLLRTAVQGADGSLYVVIGDERSTSVVRLTEWR